jgi:hypothetical protein
MELIFELIRWLPSKFNSIFIFIFFAMNHFDWLITPPPNKKKLKKIDGTLERGSSK